MNSYLHTYDHRKMEHQTLTYTSTTTGKGDTELSPIHVRPQQKRTVKSHLHTYDHRKRRLRLYFNTRLSGLSLLHVLSVCPGVCLDFKTRLSRLSLLHVLSVCPGVCLNFFCLSVPVSVYTSTHVCLDSPFFTFCLSRRLSRLQDTSV